MNLVAIFLLVTFEMVVGVEEKVQDEPNPDIITLIKKMMLRLDNIDHRFDNFDQKFEKMNQRFDTDERRSALRFQVVNERLDTINKRFDAVEVQLKEVVKKATADEQEIDANTKSVDQLSTVISTNLHNISKDVKDVKEILSEGICLRSTMIFVKSLITPTARNY